jgi:hypothetical protein
MYLILGLVRIMLNEKSIMKYNLLKFRFENGENKHSMIPTNTVRVHETVAMINIVINADGK